MKPNCSHAPYPPRKNIDSAPPSPLNSHHREGDEHNVIAICAYTITGLVTKTRDLKQVITVPLAS